MFTRRDTLRQALEEIEAGRLAGAVTIVFNRRWWEQLSPAEQTELRGRAERAGVMLHADDDLSAHYVEVRGGSEDHPLSTEHPI